MRIISVSRAGLWLLTYALLGCGRSQVAGPTSPPVTPISEAEDVPVDWDSDRVRPVHHAIFGPWYGSGCPLFGNCGCGNATDAAAEASCQLSHLASNDIPISVYLFDGGAWSEAGSVGGNACVGEDCCSWKLGDALLQQLGRQDVRALLHYWGGCRAPEQYQRAATRMGSRLLGFYLDDGADDDDLTQVAQTMQSLVAGDWENVAKAYQVGEPSISDAALSRYANVSYVGDLDYGFQGLKEAVDRVLTKASLVPAPFAEFTGYGYGDPGAPSEEVFRRRLHFGALQPVMAHTPYANCDPWAPQYSRDLVTSYRYWTWLHRELVPYFYSYAYRMYETPSAPVLRPGPNPYSFVVGEELYVPVVTAATGSMDIQLPPGNWINYWNTSQVLAGTLERFPVPLGAEPIFVRQGALIPLNVTRSYTGHGTEDSASALTVVVYPHEISSFRYREDALVPWVTFTSSASEAELTLSADPALPQPVLFRIEGWPEAPQSVAVVGSVVRVNQGGTLPRFGDERALNASAQSAWFYDAAARRLVVHAIP